MQARAIFIGSLLLLWSTGVEAQVDCYALGLRQVDLGNCLRDNETAMEAQMVAYYKRAHSAMRHFENGLPGSKATQRLQTSQVEFEQYRTAQCNFEMNLRYPGTGMPEYRHDCWMRLTQERISFLSKLAQRQ